MSFRTEVKIVEILKTLSTINYVHWVSSLISPSKLLAWRPVRVSYQMDKNGLLNDVHIVFLMVHRDCRPGVHGCQWWSKWRFLIDGNDQCWGRNTGGKKKLNYHYFDQLLVYRRWQNVLVDTELDDDLVNKSTGGGPLLWCKWNFSVAAGLQLWPFHSERKTYTKRRDTRQIM